MPTILAGIALALAATGSGLPAVAAPAWEQAPAPPASATDLAEAGRALSAGDADRALALARAHLRQQPDAPAARVLVARVHIGRGEHDAAYDELRRALAARPRDVDALYYMGLVTARLAQAQFERLAALAPDSGRVHQLMAESPEAQGRNPEAEQEYEAALRAEPRLLEALLGLGKLKRIRLACEDALPIYARAESVRPTFDGAYGLGVCHAYLQNDEEATRRFEQAIARDGRAAIAWVGLGASLTRMGRPTDAIGKLQRAIELEPRMGEAYYALGIAYQAAKQPDRAREAFRKAEELGGAVGH